MKVDDGRLADAAEAFRCMNLELGNASAVWKKIGYSYTVLV